MKTPAGCRRRALNIKESEHGWGWKLLSPEEDVSCIITGDTGDFLAVDDQFNIAAVRRFNPGCLINMKCRQIVVPDKGPFRAVLQGDDHAVVDNRLGCVIDLVDFLPV